jgi:hypothetical protein
VVVGIRHSALGFFLIIYNLTPHISNLEKEIKKRGMAETGMGIDQISTALMRVER